MTSSGGGRRTTQGCGRGRRGVGVHVEEDAVGEAVGRSSSSGDGAAKAADATKAAMRETWCAVAMRVHLCDKIIWRLGGVEVAGER